jgi:hypothetical protein
MRKKIIGIIVMCCMALSLVACDGSETRSDALTQAMDMYDAHRYLSGHIILDSDVSINGVENKASADIQFEDYKNMSRFIGSVSSGDITADIDNFVVSTATNNIEFDKSNDSYVYAGAKDFEVYFAMNELSNADAYVWDTKKRTISIDNVNTEWIDDILGLSFSDIVGKEWRSFSLSVFDTADMEIAFNADNSIKYITACVKNAESDNIKANSVVMTVLFDSFATDDEIDTSNVPINDYILSTEYDYDDLGIVNSTISDAFKLAGKREIRINGVLFTGNISKSDLENQGWISQGDNYVNRLTNAVITVGCDDNDVVNSITTSDSVLVFDDDITVGSTYNDIVSAYGEPNMAFKHSRILYKINEFDTVEFDFKNEIVSKIIYSRG